MHSMNIPNDAHYMSSNSIGSQTTTFTSEPVGPIQNYTETNTSVIIEGEAFEGSTLNLSTDSVGNLETNFNQSCGAIP